MKFKICPLAKCEKIGLFVFAVRHHTKHKRGKMETNYDTTDIETQKQKGGTTSSCHSTLLEIAWNLLIS